MKKTEQKTKKKKKKKWKRFLLIWLIVSAAGSITLILLLFHKPALYSPQKPPPGRAQGEVPTYLTHVLAPTYYNGAQRGEPFELEVIQQGINEIIAGEDWPQESEGVVFSRPEVLFRPEKVVLMAAATVKDVEFIATIEIAPSINEQGFLNLDVKTVKIGSVNITLLAKSIAVKIYKAETEGIYMDTEDIRNKIADALINGEPFNPVFPAEDKHVRVTKVDVDNEVLTINFEPAEN